MSEGGREGGREEREGDRQAQALHRHRYSV